jgi:Transposase DDE domain
MASVHGDDGWRGLVERLGELIDVEATARERGALRRRRAVGSAEDLLRLAFAFVLGRLSLRSLAAWAFEQGVADLSDVALLKRLKGSADWLGDLVAAALGASRPEAGLGLPDGRRLVAVDATAVVPPGDARNYWLVHTAFDISTQRFIAVEPSDRYERERLTRGGVRPGEIRLGDRGYACAGEIKAVLEAEADMIVRVGANHLALRDDDGQGLDRAALCRQAAANGVQDAPVRLHDHPELGLRLIVWALPPDAAEAARRKAKRDARSWGYTASAVGLTTAGCLMLVTSLPAERWPAERVLAAYRLRWQIELAFKRLKSIIGLEMLKAKDPDLARCWINTALLAGLLLDLDRPALPQEAPASPP